MGWPRREPESPKEQVTKAELEQLMSEVTSSISSLENLRDAVEKLDRGLKATIAEAKRARTELENSILVSRRKRGGW
jgi:outer membrane murein-binding lipoprotein Lpp